MRVISIKKEKILFFIYMVIIFITVFNLFRTETVETFYTPLSKKSIIIDAGHGGFDPGKVSSNNTYEKDINLQIAKKLQSYLEQGGSNVFVTRDDKDALGNTKKEDMLNRINIINDSKVDLVISIHQNSFQNESASGAQLFYFENSSESMKLAEAIQNEITNYFSLDRPRKIEANSSYYLLKKTNKPIVIVECGFLSNPSDLVNLSNEDYQNKMAWAIYKGINSYFNSSVYSRN